MLNCGYEVMHMVTNNIQINCIVNASRLNVLCILRCLSAQEKGYLGYCSLLAFSVALCYHQGFSVCIIAAHWMLSTMNTILETVVY